jgi:hypothetical protein
MINEGKYKARATDAKLGVAQTGNDTVAVAFELLDHPGEHITWYGYFTEKTVDRTMESLRYCGWQGDDVSDLTGISSNEVEIVIEHEEDREGKTRARVKWVNRAGSSKAQLKNEMNDAQKKAFAARMKGAALASRAKIPPKNTTSTEDDPIPF